MATWRREILSGVNTVEFDGTPGYIIIYGDTSDAILSNETGEVLIAAGEWGRGRVVVFSHEQFVKGYMSRELPSRNRSLLTNVQKWVTRGRSNVTVNVDANDLDRIPANGFLVWSGVNKDEAVLKKMADFVENGGSLVCGVCPWGYAQIHGIAVEDIPINYILKKLEMCYATHDEYFSTGKQLFVRDNAAEFARLDRALNLLKRGGDLRKVSKILSNVTSIPIEAYPEVKPTILTLVKSYPSVPPNKDRPAMSDQEKLVTTMLNQILVKEGMAGQVVVADGRNDFPGEFDYTPKQETVKMTISGKENQFVPTGCYLPAGAELAVSWSVVSGESKDWSVVIGAHKDELYHVKKEWRRYPKVSIKKSLDDGFLRLCNPFGGLVYFESPKAEGKIRVTLENVVPAPRYTYDTARQWETTESKKPGLWCDISGDLISFTLPSASIRQLRDPGRTLRLWDDVVRAHIDLRGTDPWNGRGQWVVSDEQPSAGYMHAGYPIVTHLDVADPNKRGGDPFLLYGNSIPNPTGNGFWGMYHEIGHNFQDQSWTWSGTGEVTVNLFTMHAMEVMGKRKVWDNEWVADNLHGAKRYLQDGANFDTWKSEAFIALYVYAQMARDFGWGAYKRVFREYNALSESAKPSTDEEKITQWMIRFSQTTGRNLCPAFEFWGFPHVDKAKKSVGHLPPYMPMDLTTTDLAPDRVKRIAMKYFTNL